MLSESNLQQQLRWRFSLERWGFLTFKISCPWGEHTAHSSECQAGSSSFSNRAGYVLKPFPTTGCWLLIHHLHMPRLVAKLVVCVFNQVSEVVYDLWGKKHTSINLWAPQHHCSTSMFLLEAPKWKPAGFFCLPAWWTSASCALKGPNPGKYYTIWLPIWCMSLLQEWRIKAQSETAGSV